MLSDELEAQSKCACHPSAAHNTWCKRRLISSASRPRHAHAEQTWRGGALFTSSTVVLVVRSFTTCIIALQRQHKTCVKMYIEVSDRRFAGVQGAHTLALQSVR